MEKLTLNIPAWHKKSCWRWFGGFGLSISLNLFLSWSSLIYEAHDSTLSHIWDCEKHKNWTLSIIKTVLISTETFMTARIKYHEPEVWWDVMPTFLFLPSHNVCSGSRCSTWDGSQGQIGHNGGLSVWLPHFTPFYRLARNAPSSVKLTPLQSVNRGQDLWVSSVINEAEEMPFLQGTFFDKLKRHSIVIVNTQFCRYHFPDAFQ